MEYFYSKKGADILSTRQAGFYVSLAVLKGVEVTLPIPVALPSKIVHGRASHSLDTLKQVRLNLANSLEKVRDEPSQLDEEVLGFTKTFKKEERSFH